MCIALMRGRKTEKKEGGWGEREGGGEKREREREGGRKRQNLISSGIQCMWSSIIS